MTRSSFFYAISGVRGGGRSTLYKELESVLPERFPECAFAFLGSPLGQLPHPLLWDEEIRKRHPTTRLFDCWASLNEFSVSKLRPALQQGKVVVVDGFGLDAVLYATACTTCKTETDEVFELHQQLVTARIKAQNIAPPVYFIVDAAAETISSRNGISDMVVVSLHKSAERRAIDRYFEPTYGQHTPLHIEADWLLGQQISLAITALTKEFEEARQQTA